MGLEQHATVMAENFVSQMGSAFGDAGVVHPALPPERNTFRDVVVDLTHRCNMQCANCYIPNRDLPDMDVAKLYDALSRLPRRTYIRLIGAEPTMRDDLPEIIRTVVRLGHKPSLTTNGLKLAHLDYCEELKRAGLNLLLISMNGADDDTVYNAMDNGKYARLKMRALENALRCGFLVDTGTIVAKGVNEQSVRGQIGAVVECAKKAGVDFRTSAPWRRLPPSIRIKSVAPIGRNMPGRSYAYSALIALVADTLGVDPQDAKAVASGSIKPAIASGGNRSLVFRHETAVGPLFVKVIDWSVNASGVPDSGNPNRGRLTQDWKIAPFFENVKANEFGY